jgi:hypothetical protein
MRTFAVEYEYFGETKVYELKPGGSQINLNNENRHEYVQLYTKYLLDDSIAVQFAAFKSGFELVCTSKLMQMFEPEELELLVCGSRDFDFMKSHTLEILQSFSSFGKFFIVLLKQKNDYFCNFVLEVIEFQFLDYRIFD